MFCEHCGTRLENDAKFCTGCGKSTSEPPAPAPVISEPVIEGYEPVSTITETPEPAEITFDKNYDSFEEAPDMPSETSFDNIPDEPIEIINENADLSDAFSNAPAEETPQYEPEYNTESSAFSEPYEQQPVDSFSNTSEIPYIPENDTPQEAAPINLYDSENYSQEAPVGDETQDAQTETFEVEEKAYTGVSGGRKFAAILLMPFILIFLITFNTVIALRFSINGENVKKACTNIDFNDLLATNIKGDTTVLSFIYDNLDDNLKNNYDVKKKNIENLAEKIDLQNYTANILGKYIDLVVLGDGSPAYTAEELSDFIKSNSDIIEEELGYKIKKKDYSEIEATFNDMNVSKYLIPANWKKDLGFDFRYTYLVLYIALAVSLIFTVMLMIWQSLILTKKGGIVTAYLGFAFIVGGIVSVAPIAYMLLTYGSSNTVLFITGNLLMPSLPFFAVIGGVELVTGIILSIVGKKLRNKTVKKQPVTE